MTVYRRLLIKYIYIVSMILILEVLFIMFVSPYFLIRYINIDSDISFLKEEVLRLSGIKPNTYYYDADLELYKNNIKRDLRIKNVNVLLKFPNKISIKIEKRVPVAFTLENDNNEIVYYMISSDGVILEKNKNLSYDLPVISGLRLKDSKVGDYLDERIVSFLKNLDELKTNYNNLYNLISELSFLKLNFYDYKITLYLKNLYNKILITVDMNLVDVIRKVLMIMNLVKNEDYLIDLRSGDIILTGESGV